jgi:hypothetical protein
MMACPHCEYWITPDDRTKGICPHCGKKLRSPNMNKTKLFTFVFVVLSFLSKASCEDWSYTIVNIQSSQPTVTASSEDKEVKSSMYVVMFSADYCSFCKVSDREDMPILKKVMSSSFTIDVQKEPEFIKARKLRFRSGTVNHAGIKKLPTYWLIEVDSNGNDVIVKEWTGRTEAKVILSEINHKLKDPRKLSVEVTENAINEKKPPLKTILTQATLNSSSNIYDGQPGSSHQNRSSLINHLLNEGIHRGRHSASSLNKMSDDQLNSLHSADHN